MLDAWRQACAGAGMTCDAVVSREWNVECGVSRGPQKAKALVYFNAKGRLNPKVQGRDEAFNTEVLACNGSAPAAAAAILPAHVESWIGVDESGKGDYFGPLITAAVLVTPEVRAQLKSAVVRDSKTMTDTMIRNSAAHIHVLCDGMIEVVTAMPEKYNALLDQPGFRGNSQNLLAWQHARALENLLEQHQGVTHAICDQFGREHVIENALMKHGRRITVVQQTKAERDVAVAAASIIAREAFLRRMQQLEREAGCQLPRGASDERAIAVAIRHIVSTHGRDALGRFAKLHFKTTTKLGF